MDTQSSKRQFSGLTLASLFGITLLPFVLAPAFMCIARILSIREIGTIFQNPFVILVHLIALAVPFITWHFLTDRLSSWNGTEQSTESCNTFVNALRKIILGYNSTLSIIIPVVIAATLRMRNIELAAFEDDSATPHLISIYFGLILLLSFSFYTTYTSSLEHSLTWLPYDKRFQTSSSKERLILMTSANIIGAYLLLFGTLSVPKIMESDSFSALLPILIPAVIISIAAIAITTSCNTRDIR
ncbi:MAG: chemotaxis protein, partial [Treponemataceae bacterium]|nr:chemotaxis protein [Treponemataceae bacterium]